MDILRYQLISSPSGLPIGILTAQTEFLDTMYLTSPVFRNGIRGVDRNKRVLFTLFVFICSLIALLAGPSSALLLIPQVYTEWGAGGATFDLIGTDESIWPSQLDAQSIGGTYCQSPSNTVLSLQQLNQTSCIWFGYQSILQWWKSTHLADGQLQTILIQDGNIERDINLRYYSLSAAAFGVTLAPCSYAQLLSQAWYMATITPSKGSLGPLSKSANIRYRKTGGTTTSMNGQLPVARTTCLTNDTVNFADIVNTVSVIQTVSSEKAYQTNVCRHTILCSPNIHRIICPH